MSTPTGGAAPEAAGETTPSPASALRGRRVVLLGGLGFIGLNLVPELLGAGARVEIVSRSLDPLALRWLARQAGGSPVGVHAGDIREVEKLQGWLQEADLVINLAGESGAVKSARDALTDAEVNVGGHLAVLEALRAAPHPARVIFISSRLVYGVTGPTPVGESHPARPTSLYGLHKLTVEHYHRLYWEHFGIPSTVLRLTNPYGSFQLPDRREHGIVNRFVLAALRGEALTLFGGGRQLRDFLHISDVTAAVLAAATAGEAVGEILNVGAGVSVSLGEMAERTVAIAGSGRVVPAPWPAGFERVETGDFLCDTGRIGRLLGWKPATDLETGLRRTVEGYREILAEAGCPAASGVAR